MKLYQYKYAIAMAVVALFMGFTHEAKASVPLYSQATGTASGGFLSTFGDTFDFTSTASGLPTSLELMGLCYANGTAPTVHFEISDPNTGLIYASTDSATLGNVGCPGAPYSTTSTFPMSYASGLGVGTWRIKIVKTSGSAPNFNFSGLGGNWGAGGAYMILYASSSQPYSLPTYANATSTDFQLGTSTCASWLDITCQLGNWSSITINFLFGVDQSNIEKIAGFNLKDTPPFDIVPTVQGIFTNASNEGAQSFASSSITTNLGSGNFTMPFFSNATIRQFVPDAMASLFRTILWSAELFAFLYLLYVQVKAIFKPKA